jgi:hypothetical protein
MKWGIVVGASGKSGASVGDSISIAIIGNKMRGIQGNNDTIGPDVQCYSDNMGKAGN